VLHSYFDATAAVNDAKKQ